ncbi:MAG: helix-turn-helix transcriptional regulator [Daejeonella sp.]|uniref:helix-turn-helix domain-containing protein n=1 Tax=Daejeonella sp. TaxID=2805397 RepID=UPI003C775C9E
MEGKEKIKAQFGIHLRKLLLERNLSLRGLASRSGLEYSLVQRIASGEVNLELTTIYALAKGLGVPAASLMPEID